MVHPGGRPREVSPPYEEMILLGEEMIKWVIENDPYHLSQWYCGEKGIIFSTWETMRKRPEFVTYYEKAMLIIGKKYLAKDSIIEPSLKHRFLRLYFKDLRKQENEDLDAEALRSAKAKLDVQNEDMQYMKQRFDKDMDQIRSLFSDRKIDDSSINNETKS